MPTHTGTPSRARDESRTDGSSTRLDAATTADLAVGMACFGSALPVSAIIGDGLPVWLAADLRLLVAALVVIPLQNLVRGDKPSVVQAVRDASRRDRLLLVGVALIGTFAFSALMLVGMRHAPGAVAAVVMGTTPAVTALGAFAFLREHLGVWRIVAVGLAAAGVMVVNVGSHATHGSGGNLLLGSLLIFGAVCCEASYSLMGKRLTAELSPLAITATASVLAAVATAPLAVWDLRNVAWGDISVGEWLAVLWWGAGSMALGSWLWFRGMARVAGSTAATFMGVMPLSALVLSYLLLGEDPQWIHLLGLMLVLAGLFSVAHSERSGAASAGAAAPSRGR